MLLRTRWYRRATTASFAILIAVVVFGQAHALTYLVRPDGNGDFATIQDAIDGANIGDVIELADGVFVGAGNRNISYNGKAITIRSQSGEPETCVIDVQGRHNGLAERGFLFNNNEGPASVLRDVTIVNAVADAP